MDDLRDFLDVLDEFDEVQRIKVQVDWNLEMGAITRRCYDLGAPAALFENIKGYPQGFRTLGAPLGASKKGIRYLLELHWPWVSAQARQQKKSCKLICNVEKT
jgi:4-hydroxy-3-polyprenylbenzoate decarboxylase